MVLNRMSQSDESLSAIHKLLPQFVIVKDKVGLEGLDPEKLIEDVSNLFDDADKNTLDGVKFTWDNKWVHLRKSNTEPIMRIYAEAHTTKDAQELVKQVRSCL
jgi:phosphomannomutase